MKILKDFVEFANRYERAITSIIVLIAIIALSFLAASCSVIKPKVIRVDGMKMIQTQYGSVHKYQIPAIKESKRVYY